MKLIGYVRVSTAEQDPSLQVKALTDVGVFDVRVERASGKGRLRVRDQALSELGRGDRLVVWRLDRLGRSLHDILVQLEALVSRGVEIHSVREHIDTTTAAGRMQVGILATLAQYEADLIQERTLAGLAAARARGQRLGRPSSLTDEQRATVYDLVVREGRSRSSVARLLGTSERTIRRVLAGGE